VSFGGVGLVCFFLCPFFILAACFVLVCGEGSVFFFFSVQSGWCVFVCV